MECAKKIAEAQASRWTALVMTELGITKGPSKNYTEDDIEKIVAACWKGEGRKKNAAKPERKIGGNDSGAAVGVAGPAEFRPRQAKNTTDENEIKVQAESARKDGYCTKKRDESGSR